MEWLDDAQVNGVWGVRIELPAFTNGSLNSVCRMLYAPTSHSNARKSVASESIFFFSYGTEANTMSSVSKRGRRTIPTSSTIPFPLHVKISRALGGNADVKLSLPRQGWTLLQNTTVGHTGCSIQRRQPQPLELDPEVYNLLYSIAINGSDWDAI